MKAAFLFFLACIFTLHAQTREVPESRSRDGKWAVFYETTGEEVWRFSVHAVSGKRKFPLDSTAEIKDTDDEQRNRRLMYILAAIALDRWFSDGWRSGAEECRVSWNSDATLLAVEAGAHKFAGFRVYRKSAHGLSELPFPQDYEDRLIDFATATSPKIHEMGVNRFGDHKGILTDSAWVNLLEDGYIAVSAYGAMCHRAFQELPQETQDKVTESRPDLFFLFHVGAKGSAKFVGFCH